MLAAEGSRGRLRDDDSNGPPQETSRCFIGTVVSGIKKRLMLLNYQVTRNYYTHKTKTENTDPSLQTHCNVHLN